MKKLILTLSIAIASYSSYGQTNTLPSSGNVGIGTTSPLAKTSIVGGSSAGDGSDQTGILQITTGTGANTDNKLLFGVHNSDYSWIQAIQPGNDIRNLVLNPMAGNVGIGTTTPLENLSVIAPNNSTNQIGFGVTGEQKSALYHTNSHGLLIYSSTITNANHPMHFLTGGVLADERMTILGNGNVGIGTTSPSSLLNISGVTPIMRIDAANNNATGTLHFQGRDSNGGQTSKAQIVQGVTETVNGIGSTLDFLTTKESSSGMTFNSSMFIDKLGNIGVGTIGPDQKLTVKGKIHSSEVIVDAMTTVPDYVFEADYKLKSLNDIKAYVDKNHHLPEIPSAKEMEKNGISLGDMNMKLLKTIEELTLHVISQNERIEKLEKKLIRKAN